MDNYFREFPHIDPLLSYKPWAKYESNANGMLMPEIERQIAAVFVCSDPVDWSRDIQVSEPFQVLSRLHLVIK